MSYWLSFQYKALFSSKVVNLLCDSFILWDLNLTPSWLYSSLCNHFAIFWFLKKVKRHRPLHIKLRSTRVRASLFIQVSCVRFPKALFNDKFTKWGRRSIWGKFKEAELLVKSYCSNIQCIISNNFESLNSKIISAIMGPKEYFPTHCHVLGIIVPFKKILKVEAKIAF